jgi:hypothetical protein
MTSIILINFYLIALLSLNKYSVSTKSISWLSCVVIIFLSFLIMILIYIYLILNTVYFKFNQLLSNQIFKQSWLIFFIQQKLNIEVPVEFQQNFSIHSSFLILNLLLLSSFLNLIFTVAVLYYKNTLKLEIRFKNRPWILKLIKYYEKSSYITIIYEIFLITIILILMIALNAMGIYFILKLIY